MALIIMSMCSQVELSVTTDGALHFGDVVMLLNVGDTGECSALGINAYIDHMTKIPSPGIKGPCGVSAGRSIQPCVRTAFIITRYAHIRAYTLVLHQPNLVMLLV